MSAAGVRADAAPGQLDPDFGNAGRVLVNSANGGDTLHALALQSDDKSVLGGTCFNGNVSVMCVSRLLSNGQSDTAFGTNGRVLLQIGSSGSAVTSLAIQDDGKIVIGGACVTPNGYEFCLARLQTDGTVDAGFGVGGTVKTDVTASEDNLWRIRILPDGRIVAVGACGAGFGGTVPPVMCLARYASNGALDPTFGAQGTVRIEVANGGHGIDVLALSDGRLLVAGNCSDGGYLHFCATRLLPDGSRDYSYGNGGLSSVVMGESYEGIYGATLATGELPVLSGYCWFDGAYQFCLARLTAAGSLDVTFGDAGRVRVRIGNAGGMALGVTSQDNGKIVALGNCPGSPGNDFCLARYRPDGSLDASFGVAGQAVTPIGTGADWGRRLAIQSDGKIVAAGHCMSGSAQLFCAARYEGDTFPATACALNADGNRVTTPATDGLLILRYLLGARGDALSSGAAGVNATRFGQSLESHVASLDLDADGDGQALATTDGLLILRAILGLTGEALTAGAINASHPNVRNAQQILSWVETTHGVACLP